MSTQIKTISAEDLYYTPISHKESEMIIEDMVPQGLTILAGAPKSGKSWLALDMGLAVAAGEPLLGKETIGCGVLYFALEDRDSRLQKRLHLIEEEEPPDNLFLATECLPLRLELLNSLNDYLIGHPDIRLIIFDTLQMIRKGDGGTSRSNQYGKDTEDLSLLKKYADEKNIAKGIKCLVLAPSTISVQNGKRRKSDRRDAENIARNMANNSCSYVHPPTRDDEQVKDYIRMRDDHKAALKKVKQQINAFCLRHGHQYPGKTKWTIAHMKWLRTLDLDPLDTEILNEYLLTYEYQINRIEQFDARIEDLASMEAYEEKVQKLRCFLGIETVTALALVAETGDFERFRKGNLYAAYLGLVPGEDSSADDINHLRISKAGNVHLRKLLTEASQSICKGQIGHKSKALKARQRGNDSAVIAYADRANERMRRKYYRMIQRGKTRNVAVTAVSRELACFVWGMMTDNINKALA